MFFNLKYSGIYLLNIYSYELPYRTVKDKIINLLVSSLALRKYQLTRIFHIHFQIFILI